MGLDTGRYLLRIGWPVGELIAPDIQSLRRLQHFHCCNIPFENLDVLFERTIGVDKDALIRKLIEAGRGGYCYELNGLFYQALQAFGFQVTSLAARVLISRPQAMPARTHQLLRVILNEDAWLVDVGFGGQTPCEPLLLQADIIQTTRCGSWRLSQNQDGWLLSVLDRNKWAPLYQFDEQQQYLSDFQMANHYVATWPTSHFRHNLLASRYTLEGGQYRLLNYRLTKQLASGETHVCTLPNHIALWRCLQDIFKINVTSSQYGIASDELGRVMTHLLSSGTR